MVFANPLHSVELQSCRVHGEVGTQIIGHAPARPTAPLPYALSTMAVALQSRLTRLFTL